MGIIVSLNNHSHSIPSKDPCDKSSGLQSRQADGCWSSRRIFISPGDGNQAKGAKWKNYSAHWPGKGFGKLLWRNHWNYQFRAQQWERKVNKIIGDVSSKRERNDQISFFYSAALYPFYSNLIDLQFLCSRKKMYCHGAES